MIFTNDSDKHNISVTDYACQYNFPLRSGFLVDGFWEPGTNY